MQGKIVVITGATSGIGRQAALQLARLGAGLVLVGRDQRRGADALAWLKERVPGAAASVLVADLSRLSEIRRLAAALRAEAPRIDVLVNNAGAIFDRHALTEDGIERTFALNHLAYFLLTHLLRDRLEAAAPARIVNVASEAHRGAALDFADVAGMRGDSGWSAYKRSKLANILFTAELARRLAGTGVTANCLHPGFVASRFGDETGPLLRFGLRLAKRVAAISPEEGARTIAYLASSPEAAGVSGRYFAKCRALEPSPAARDDAAARRLWDESARLCGLAS